MFPKENDSFPCLLFIISLSVFFLDVSCDSLSTGTSPGPPPTTLNQISDNMKSLRHG